MSAPTISATPMRISQCVANANSCVIPFGAKSPRTASQSSIRIQNMSNAVGSYFGAPGTAGAGDLTTGGGSTCRSGNGATGFG